MPIQQVVRSLITRRGRRLPIAGLLILVVAGSWAVTAAMSGARGDSAFSVHVGSTPVKAEIGKTVPITRKAGQAKRVVMSLKPSDVGTLRSGDRIESSAELEVSVTCLEPLRQCQGSIYKYSPTIQSRLILSRDRKSAGGAKTTPISNWKDSVCSQDLPNRNHHCVLVIPAASRVIEDVTRLPCQPSSCRVNMVISAFNRRAKAGNKLVIGADEDNGSISQEKSVLNVAVYHPDKPQAQLHSSNRPSNRSLPVRGSTGDKRVIYSVRLPELRAKEQLVVDAKMVARITHLDYNVLLQSQLVLSERPGSIRRNGVPAKITDRDARVSPINGFNCTQGGSGHRSPCTIRKVAVIRIQRDARVHPELERGPRVPLYMNLVTAARGVYNSHRMRAGDRVKVSPRAGYMHVHRYGPQYHR